MFLLLFLLPGALALYENCDYYQRLEAGEPYYVYSPNYPNSYTPGSSCRWYAESPPGTQIFLTCENTRIPYSQSCNLDVLSVSPSGDVNLYDADNHCGGGGFSIISTSNKMNIALMTSRNSPGGSFLCNIGVQNTPVQPPEGQCECGWKNGNRIVGGKETGVNEYPMMAGLIDGQKKELFCGATIISQNYAMTAAHCLLKKRPGQIALLVGDHDTSRGNDTDSAQLIVVDSFKVHEDYDPVQQLNDIAIVHVKTPITFNMRVGPACLPFTNFKQTFAGESVQALGWGTTEFGGGFSNTLQKVDLNVLTLAQCKNTYGNMVSKNQVCTFARGKDACQADSGGPLLWEDPNTRRVKLLGIISYGIQCATNDPSVNTRVTQYLPWLMTNADDEYCVK